MTGVETTSEAVNVGVNVRPRPFEREAPCESRVCSETLVVASGDEYGIVTVTGARSCDKAEDIPGVRLGIATPIVVLGVVVGGEIYPPGESLPKLGIVIDGGPIVSTSVDTR